MLDTARNGYLLNPEEVTLLCKKSLNLSTCQNITLSTGPFDPSEEVDFFPPEGSSVNNFLQIFFGHMGGRQLRMCCMRVHGNSREEQRRSINRILTKLKWWKSHPHDNLISIQGFFAAQDIPRLMLVSSSSSMTIRQYMLLHPEFDRLRGCIDIAVGLDFLHRNSIVHGAVRGSNVLVKEDGSCFLGEFDPEHIPTQSTLNRYANWIAPELVEVKKFHKFLIDHYRSHDYSGEYQMASDIFSLGCTAIEIYTNEPPAVMHIPYETIKTHKDLASYHRESSSKEEIIPKKILSIILAMLSFIPHRRPQSDNAVKWLKNPDMLRISSCPPLYAKGMLWRAYREKDI